MNSSVKQAQKEGASIEDIAAACATPWCATPCTRSSSCVIPANSATLWWSRAVRSSRRVLRAFELLTERQVTRPNIAGLMGAFAPP